MGSGLKKRRGYKPMPGYDKSELESKAYLWCIKNNIKISPFAVLKSNPRTWWVDVEINGKVKRSPYKYDENQIWPKIFELYAFYYKKYGLRKTV
jgi:hypothetical protein